MDKPTSDELDEYERALCAGQTAVLDLFEWVASWKAIADHDAAGNLTDAEAISQILESVRESGPAMLEKLHGVNTTIQGMIDGVRIVRHEHS